MMALVQRAWELGCTSLEGRVSSPIHAVKKLWRWKIPPCLGDELMDEGRQQQPVAGVLQEGCCSQRPLLFPPLCDSPFLPDDTDKRQKERLPWPTPGYLLYFFRWQHFLCKALPSNELLMSAAPGLWSVPHHGECIALLMWDICGFWGFVLCTWCLCEFLLAFKSQDLKVNTSVLWWCSELPTLWGECVWFLFTNICFFSACLKQLLFQWVNEQWNK